MSAVRIQFKAAYAWLPDEWLRLTAPFCASVPGEPIGRPYPKASWTVPWVHVCFLNDRPSFCGDWKTWGVGWLLSRAKSRALRRRLEDIFRTDVQLQSRRDT